MLGQGVSAMYGGSGRRDREVVTPHNIAILLFIQKYTRNPPKYWDSQRPSVPDPIPPPPDLTPEERKATCLMTVRLIQGGDMTLSQVLRVLEAAPLLPLHLTTFINALHQMYREGIENLLDLFDVVEKFAVQDPNRADSFPCLWTSVVGLYLRRLNLTFRRLSFSQVTSLYTNFQLYYQECYSTCPPPPVPPLHHHSQMTTEDSNIADDTDSDDKMEDVVEERRKEDEDDVDGSAINLTMCSAEVMAINSTTEEDGERGGVTAPEEEEMMHPPILIPRSGGVSREAGHSSRQQAELFISQQTSLLQFSDTAALPPPVLQARIKQLVKHNPDMAEAHFLSYLNCLRAGEYCGAVHSLLRAFDGHPGRGTDGGRGGEAGRGGSGGDDAGRGFRYAAMNLAALHAQFGHKEIGVEVLREAVRLAQESSDHTCLQHCLAWLYTLSNNYKCQLMQRSIVKSSELSLNYLSCLARLGHVAELAYTPASPASLLQSVAQGESMTWQLSLVSLQHGGWGLRGALWCSWGAPVMAALASQLLLHLNTRHPAIATTAAGKSAADAFYAGQPTCAAVCNVAIALANLGEYHHAASLLHHASLRFPVHSSHSHTWMFANAHVALTDHLHAARWTRASAALTNMATTHPTEARLRRSDLLIAVGDLVGAWRLLGELRGEGSGVVGEARVRLLLTESCVVVAAGGWAVAIPTLVEALTLTTKHHLAYLTALTHLHIANVQLHLGLVREAESSMKEGLGGVLAGGSVYDQARARLLHAKLTVIKAEVKERCIKVVEVAETLNLVSQLFLKVRAFHRAREAIYLKARLYHEVGYLEERNKCALEFRQFELQHPCQAYQLSINAF